MQDNLIKSAIVAGICFLASLIVLGCSFKYKSPNSDIEIIVKDKKWQREKSGGIKSHEFEVGKDTKGEDDNMNGL